jgi:4-hydroxy-2-oxovalerate aldolase
MDCTIRDGSYVINFNFTAVDTSSITRALDRTGVPLIEIGHGIGLGAADAGMGDAAETDETYMRSVAGTLERARWGMFCIPGVARLAHIDMAADHGMNFVRIGSNIGDVEDSRPFIERAKHHGMIVCTNFMKSYASPPAEFARRAVQSADYGADVIYLVDSAGGMLPEEVRTYLRAVRDVSPVRLGFHGHNNLGLALGNALVAIDNDATIIDASLQGLGRSAGNVVIEQLVCALSRRGISLGIDPIDLMDVGERLIIPLITQRGINSIDIASGLGQFHSSYISIIREFASAFKVDPRRLILAVCESDKVNAPRSLVRQAAERLAAAGQTVDATTARFHFDRYVGNEQN